MTDKLSIPVIARIRTDLPSKFGIPKQSGLVKELKGAVIFEPPYRDLNAVRGLEGFSHLWLIWHFSGNANKPWSPTVRPPRLGGNTRLGVFATRSPFRPSGLGLSAVKLDSIEFTEHSGPVLHVSGVDLMDDTPIVDIKPYLPGDAISDATGGFAQAGQEAGLGIVFPQDLLDKVPPDKRGALMGVLQEDPRPAYQEDPSRRYGFPFAGLEIRFVVDKNTLTVVEVE